MADNKIAPIDELRGQLAHKDTYQQILNYFGGDEEITRKFVSSAVHVCRTTPKLLACKRYTLIDALITCADLKLFPSSASGEAFILPYKDEAKFQLGYKGIITLLYRAGVSTISSKIVYANDTFHYQEGLHPLLDHIPAAFGKPKGEPIAVYAIAVVNGERLFHVMSKEDVMVFRDFSKSAKTDFSPWKSNDPELWMWRKTCIKQLAKTLPQNESLAKAIERDNQDSTVSDRRNISRELDDVKKPTMGSLAAGKNDPHDKKTKAEKPQSALDFGVADNSAEGQDQ